MTHPQDGPDLFTGTREHDLPPRWDGEPVTWAPWGQDSLTVFICPPLAPEPCSWCGSTAGEDTATGTLRSRWRRQQDRLVVHRCRGCLRDRVLECWSGQWWDLDEHDYEPGGSYATSTPHP